MVLRFFQWFGGSFIGSVFPLSVLSFLYWFFGSFILSVVPLVVLWFGTGNQRH